LTTFPISVIVTPRRRLSAATLGPAAPEIPDAAEDRLVSEDPLDPEAIERAAGLPSAGRPRPRNVKSSS
jgi:hypothetical protein